MAYRFPTLSYHESNMSIECPHRLMGEMPQNLIYVERIRDRLQEILEAYGEYNEDFVSVVNRDVFCVYFKDKSAAMRFKLAW